MNEQQPPCDVELDGFPVANGGARTAADQTLDGLLTQFTSALRRGETPQVEDYLRSYPHFAEEIRELFPLVATLEGWKSDRMVETLRRSVPDEFSLKRLGPFRLVREVGRGGMGVVFEAVRDRGRYAGKRLAVKLLPWRVPGDLLPWKARFHREAATIARLRHRNIVRVYAFGTHQGYCYYVMPLIDGTGLDTIIRRLRSYVGSGPAADGHLAEVEEGGELAPVATCRDDALCGLRRDSWRRFAEIGVQVALALGYAHVNGVVHNDVKPANLLLTKGGEVIVTDFGVSRGMGGEPTGSDDQPMGTLRYMAPERLAGRCDVRSDVYSLGATLYELVTQTPMHAAAERHELIEHILHSPPRRPRAIVPVIPRALETIILNAVAANPEERYSSAAALAADLHRYLQGESVSRLRPGLARRLFGWGRQKLLGAVPAPAPR